jgi:hypothetical protein
MKLFQNPKRLLFLVTLLILFWKYINAKGIEPDTIAMIRETEEALKCVANQQWANCRMGGQFPLLQKLLSAPLLLVGYNQTEIAKIFVFLNLGVYLSLLKMVWDSILKQTKNRGFAQLTLVLLVCCPLPWYAKTSFSEMLAAFLTFALTYSLVHRRSSAVWVPLLILAGLSKETAFPFLALLSLVAVWITEKKVTLKFLSTLFLAVLATFGINGAFNYFRFGSLFNQAYFDTTFLVQNFSDQLSFFLAIWFSPAGGLVFFWPLFVLWILVPVWFLILEKRPLSKAIPEGGVLVLLFGLTWGFSKWYSPFGWVAWGTRLMMPWIPACIYLLSLAYFPVYLSFFSMMKKKRVLFSTFWAVLLSSTLIQFYALFSSDYKWVFFKADAICPHVPVIQKDPIYYYTCVNHQLWGAFPHLIFGLIPERGSQLIALGFTFTALFILSYYLTRIFKDIS